jgi:hypothetical protein
MKSKTNIALVHRAWANGSSRRRVIPFFQQQGFNVTAAQIPLTSLADVATRNLLAAQKGRTVLAGHSYAGVVIPGRPIMLRTFRPARAAVNASTAPLRAAPDDSGPMRVATLHSYDFCIHYTSPV